MKHLIDKDAVVAEINRVLNSYDPNEITSGRYALNDLRDFLDTLEVKKVEEKFERPNINVNDAEEVSSRMKYIDEDLKPIAEFILDYANWNLHKDEWSSPTLEVPVFRVLDALIQRGKPYCAG